MKSPLRMKHLFRAFLTAILLTFAISQTASAREHFYVGIGAPGYYAYPAPYPYYPYAYPAYPVAPAPVYPPGYAVAPAPVYAPPGYAYPAPAPAPAYGAYR